MISRRLLQPRRKSKPLNQPQEAALRPSRRWRASQKTGRWSWVLWVVEVQGSEVGPTAARGDMYTWFINGSYGVVLLESNLSVENAENRGLYVLNTHAHWDYVVLTSTYQLASRHSWKHPSLIGSLLFLLHLHWQLIGTLTHGQSHHITHSVLLKHILSDLFWLNFPETVSWLLLGNWENRPTSFEGFLDLDLWVTVLLLRLCTFLFLLFGFTFDISKGIPVIGVEAFMMEVAFLTVFTDFMKVVHVELNVKRTTCLTKDE